jgi:deoxycytidylate deaminase
MRADAHRTVGSTLYVNGSPCHDCAKLIAGSKVARLVCLNDTAYSSWDEKSKPYLLDVGVEVVDIPMEQFYIDYVTPIRGLSLERPQAQHIYGEA